MDCFLIFSSNIKDFFQSYHALFFIELGIELDRFGRRLDSDSFPTQKILVIIILAHWVRCRSLNEVSVDWSKHFFISGLNSIRGKFKTIDFKLNYLLEFCDSYWKLLKLHYLEFTGWIEANLKFTKFKVEIY